MKKSEALGFNIQSRIDYEERLENARRLAKAEKHKDLDEFYHKKSTDHSGSKDREEINTYLEMK